MMLQFPGLCLCNNLILLSLVPFIYKQVIVFCVSSLNPLCIYLWVELFCWSAWVRQLVREEIPFLYTYLVELVSPWTLLAPVVVLFINEMCYGYSKFNKFDTCLLESYGCCWEFPPFQQSIYYWKTVSDKHVPFPDCISTFSVMMKSLEFLMYNVVFCCWLKCVNWSVLITGPSRNSSLCILVRP